MNPNFRDEYIFQLDGASWHVSNENLKFLQKMRIPTMISGPYQYNGAPIELLFANLKRGNLNPEGLPLGKSKYII